jgi:mannosyltransferase OCH1-like enzyme
MQVIIQGLWIGERLSTMGVLSIRSFQAHGAEYHLYTYDDLPNVPEGVVLKDAAKILPQERLPSIQQGPRNETWAAASDVFRYHLLHQRGGWWCDLDVICLKPFDFDREPLFCSEKASDWYRPWGINTCVIRTAVNSPVMAECIRRARAIRQDKIEWGALGPALLSSVVFRYWAPRMLLRGRLIYSYIERTHIFQPICHWEATEVVQEEKSWDLSRSYAVHLYNELWLRAGLDPDAQYLDGCLYERLKRRYSC